MWQWLRSAVRSLLGKRAEGGILPAQEWQVIMYTRQGCHLCEEAWQQLTGWQREHGFQLQAIDVDSSPELAAEHGESVPVVAINGRVRFRGRINPVLWHRLLG